MHHVPTLPAVIQYVVPFLDHYGYVAIFLGVFLEDFGLPLPGETILVAASILAGQHVFHITDVIVVALLGGITGDTVGFMLGRRFGHHLLWRFGHFVGLKPNVLERFNGWVVHRGVWLIAGARFVDGFRQLNGWIAGANRVPWKFFVPLNTLGAGAWVSAWALSGYFFSHRILAIMAQFKMIDIAMVGFVVVGVGLPLILHYAHKLRRKRADVDS
ncbi:MAG: hypothetical protein C7B44_05210 [Sulfobacillus thermosulfidooxidans]|uniref:VTT domain-containing protein n=1 Tax=Sulfobacillus thermotolerans TaxID=338644 RepID=A0ABN5GYY1_9FIRM|nr:hypothetical protein BXT84_07145 [Sulfobacillus thermotolerans]PSR37152.1 MAG: hypothetical protein C7B44_05210 [Sulfobacillus thermosulfidooxidans]